VNTTAVLEKRRTKYVQLLQTDVVISNMMEVK